MFVTCALKVKQVENDTLKLNKSNVAVSRTDEGMQTHTHLHVQFTLLCLAYASMRK